MTGCEHPYCENIFKHLANQHPGYRFVTPPTLNESSVLFTLREETEK